MSETDNGHSPPRCGHVTLKGLPTKAGVYCMPWGLRGSASEAVHGGVCCYCGIEIAVPESKRSVNAGCIYCGLGNGDLPLMEAEQYGPDVLHR